MTSPRSPYRWVAATLTAAGMLCGAFSGAGEAEATAGPPADSRRDMIMALPAPGPHPSLGDEARAFDRLVGTWECDYSFYSEDGTISRASGELRFGWIIDGRALQDIWITYPKGPEEERLIGTSLRFFDAKTRMWRVVFVLPALDLLTTVEGRAEGDRIVLEGQASDGSQRRWSFNDIRPNSFVWRGEKSRDGGKTWKRREEHHMKRRQ
jgi:uncharacterized protein